MKRALILPVALVLVLAGCGRQSGTVTPQTTTTSTTTASAPEWVRCENTVDRYSTEYPSGWRTNTGEVVPACSQFDPEPLVIPPASEFPLDIAVSMKVQEVDYARATGPDETSTPVSTENSEVAGRRAQRTETRSNGNGLLPEGTLTTRWVIDLNGRILTATSHNVGDLAYAEKQRVLDRMVETITFITDGSTTTTTTEVPDGLPPIAEPSARDQVSSNFPGGNTRVARLTDVRLARQDGFDRFVMEFNGSQRPAHRIRYVEATAVRAPGSGRQVSVDGQSFLEITLQPATAVEITGETVRSTYDGPRRLTLSGASNIQEAARVGDFEASLSWVIGVDDPAPFAVAWLENPTRLVVDVLAR